MTEAVKPVPDGYMRVTPHLVVDGAAEAIEFYQKAFGAEEVQRMPAPDGKRLMHAEILINGGRIMLVDAFPEYGSRSPKSLGGTAVTLHLFVEDADAVFERAVAAGGTATMPVSEMFWGDRYGKLTDPYGHEWSVATRVAEPSREEMMAAAAKMMGGPTDG
ncbi:MAG: VOC family protein [Alphaproteobacteria bacterium]|nr:VOC family protein [Alphaproteobacteria bacterium]